MRRGTEQAAGYAVVDTCAADGICAAACPVAINTGDLVKDKRAAALGPWAQRAASVAAGRWQLCLLLVRTGLRLVHAAPALGRIVYRLMRRMHGLPPASLPVDLPLPARGRAVGRSDPTSRAVYFPSCLGDVFAAPDGPGVGKAFLSLCTKSGVTVSIPPGVAGSCCAVPWTSKGLRDGARVMAARTLGLLWEESDGGRLPVVCDAASCTQGLTQLRPHLSEADQDRFDRLRILDALTFVEAELLPRLTTTTTLRDVTVHATCATDKLHISGTLSRLAGLAADTVITPPDEGCCGFAGDRGFLLPELTAAATRAEASDVRARPTAAYVSANATCELGMTRATGRPYRHVLELLDQCTQPQDR
jgi:D-lactate dehydrogenase